MLIKQMRVGVEFGIIIALGVFAFVGQVLPVRASVSRAVAYNLTLTINGSTTITCNTSTPALNALFNHPATKPSNGETVNLYIDNVIGNSGSITPISSTEDQLYYSGVSGLSVGSHQLQVKYLLTTTSTLIVSNTITVTVAKGDISNFTCGIVNHTYTYALGQDIILAIGLSPIITDGSFSVTFKGPTTVTTPNLKLDSKSEITVKVPGTPGQYQLLCGFEGSSQYNPNNGYSLGVLVSAQH